MPRPPNQCHPFIAVREKTYFWRTSTVDFSFVPHASFILFDSLRPWQGWPVSFLFLLRILQSASWKRKVNRSKFLFGNNGRQYQFEVERCAEVGVVFRCCFLCSSVSSVSATSGFSSDPNVGRRSFCRLAHFFSSSIFLWFDLFFSPQFSTVLIWLGFFCYDRS